MCRGCATISSNLPNLEQAIAGSADSTKRQRCAAGEVEGLRILLASLSLTGYLDAASLWCENNGITTVDAVIKDWENLAMYLQLKPLELRRVKRYCTDLKPSDPQCHGLDVADVQPDHSLAKRVRFASSVIVMDLDGHELGMPAQLATVKDTRKSYTQAHAERIMPRGTFEAQEERGAAPVPASFDPAEPAVLLAMVWSGIYKISGAKHRGLASSYLRAGAGPEATNKEDAMSRRKYWQQFEKELKPIFSTTSPRVAVKL